MMGAGDFPAGAGPMGADPVDDPGAARPLTPPRAILFDGATRTFPYDDNGRLIDIHPVDQAVALSLMLEFRKVASHPTAGSTLRQAPIAEGQKLQTDVERRVFAALQKRIAARDIKILSISASVGPRWRLKAKVRYQNLRQPQSRPRTVEI